MKVLAAVLVLALSTAYDRSVFLLLHEGRVVEPRGRIVALVDHSDVDRPRLAGDVTFVVRSIL